MSEDYYLQCMNNALMMWAAASAADKAYWWRLYVGYLQQALQAGFFRSTAVATSEVALEATVVSLAEKMVAKEGTMVVAKRLGTRAFIRRLVQTMGGTGPLKHPVIVLAAVGITLVSTASDVHAESKELNDKQSRYARYVSRYLKGLAMWAEKHPNAIDKASPPDTFDEWVNSGEP
jgi:hypothetical protein